MKTIRSMGSDSAPRRVPTARDEEAAWEELCEALRDYSAAVSLLEQLTLDWLADREVAAPAPSSLGPARLDVAEATCTRARVRCTDALARLDALGLPVEGSVRPADQAGRIIPFPVDRLTVPAAIPARAPDRAPRRARRPRPRLIADHPAG